MIEARSESSFQKRQTALWQQEELEDLDGLLITAPANCRLAATPRLSVGSSGRYTLRAADRARKRTGNRSCWPEPTKESPTSVVCCVE